MFGYFKYRRMGNGDPLSCLVAIRNVTCARTLSCLIRRFGILLSRHPILGGGGPTGVGGKDGTTGKVGPSSCYTHVLTRSKLAFRSIATQICGVNSAGDVFRRHAFHPNAVSRHKLVAPGNSSIVVRCCSLRNLPIACVHGCPGGGSASASHRRCCHVQ